MGPSLVSSGRAAPAKSAAGTRILHIGKYYPPSLGGMERYLGDLVTAQQAAGHEVAVLVHDDGCGGDDPDWLRRCPVWFRLVFAPISPAFPLWLRRAIRNFSPDLLHIHMPNLSALWVLALPAARRLPWVVHWHADVEPSRFRLSLRLAYPWYRVFERALLERAEVIVATSPNYLETSEPLGPWRHKCRVVPLGVDPRRLPDVAPEETTGLWHDALATSPSGGEVWRGGGDADRPASPGGKRPTRLLAIGRLTYYKGYETLIRAVSGLAGCELVIVGAGEERRNLERLLDELGRPRWIRLAGAADDTTCLRLLASCDVYCLPSRERTEAFGIVLMEAMRYGRPIIASNLAGSGVAWVVRQDDNGVLVPVGDIAAWRTAIAGLARDGERRRALGERGRARFRAELDIARGAQVLTGLYAGLLDRPAAQAHVRPLPLIVIPARDEAETIAAVIAGVRAQGFQDIVVVDDGSRDATAGIARSAGATVLTAPLSQGAWGAMQTGIRYAVHHGYPGVVTMDADGQHEPEQLPALVAASARSDVVIGACPERGSRLRRLAWRYFRFITGFGIEDLTSGFRYYSGTACQVLVSEEATLLDYQDIGVLLLLHRAGFEIAEKWVTMVPRRSGASRIFSSWGAVARYMAETTLLCLARWNTRSTRK